MVNNQFKGFRTNWKAMSRTKQTLLSKTICKQMKRNSNKLSKCMVKTNTKN